MRQGGIVDPNSHISVLIQEGRNYPQKSEELYCFEVLDVLCSGLLGSVAKPDRRNRNLITDLSGIGINYGSGTVIK
jgi:hypothetical protein